MNYSANEREISGLTSFLQRSRWYLEGFPFEIITDNQVLNYFFSKQKPSKREAIWLQKIGNFGIFELNFKGGKLRLLGDDLSRAPNVTESNDTTSAIVSSVQIQVGDLLHAYNEDQLFRPI